jgi:colanic acid/amylovoran biosynthesis glycosyltransferase
VGGPYSRKTGIGPVGELSAASPKVAFLYATFPRPTETFVRRELTALWGIGAEITPISIWRGDDAFEGRKIDRFRLPELLSLLFWLPYWVFFRPQAFREVLGDLWNRPCPSAQNWNETFLGLGFALVRAHEMKLQGYVLCHAVWATMPATAALALNKLVGIEYSMGAHAYDVFRGHGDWLLERKLKEAVFVRTSSASTEQRLFALGLSSEKLKLVRRGLSKWPSVTERGSFAAPIQILSVGRLVSKKGYFEQLLILEALLAAGVQFEARIVGGGPLRDELERERDRLGLAGRVTFLGALPEDEAHSLFSESDVFLFTGKVAPDGDRDGLPNVIPEAMSAGVVVIASPHGGAAEALEEGVTGFVRDPHQTNQWVELIQGLLASPKKVISLRKAAVAAARIRFDVKRTARELFTNLLGACKG